MGTPAQNAANLLNAQKSTGPRSDAGKAASRFNAFQHGMDARSAVIPGEDAAGLEALARDYRRENRPSGPEETFLVETLIQADWNRRRYALIETQLMTRLLDELEPCEYPLAALFAANSPASRMLDRVVRHREAAERAWFRAFKELQRLRKERHSPDLPGFDLDSDAAETPGFPINWVRSVNSSVESPAPSAPARPAPEPPENLALRL